MEQKYRAIGLMSGTSLDAIDVAFIETDGRGSVSFIAAADFPYDPQFREQIRACFDKRQSHGDPHILWLEEQLTKRHGLAVQSFLKDKGISPESVDLIGFHGQTIWHDPANRETLQIGSGALLADMTGISVVNDFRSTDVKAGGQGAPLVPLYHQALASSLPKPLGIINIGGVSNITYIGSDGELDILAFDMGPGNALLNDFVLKEGGQSFDKDGALAAKGVVDYSYLELMLHHPYFDKQAPKSLDRNAFRNFMPHGLSAENGAATLTMMSVRAITHGLKLLPEMPKVLYLTGGGRHNKTMCDWLAQESHLEIKSVDELGWRGDSMEAEAFAYLAVRSVLGLPLSLPTTTCVPEPMTGGVFHKVASK